MFDAELEAPPAGGLIVVGFAGGGGSSLGIRLALGRDPDLAMNHKAVCVQTHAANFPATDHIQADIFEMDPTTWRTGEPIGLAWFSPDCTDFSKAKGKAPRSPRIRGLAWSVVPWAVTRRPKVIMVENVEEFEQWGPVYRTGPHAGEPIPERRGETFQRWVSRFQRLGYTVTWRKSRAAGFGDPTTRVRLLVIMVLGGEPAWPAVTHAPRDKAVALGLQPWRGAYECIDFTRPCPSIFMTQAEAKAAGLNVKRPLVKATMGRVARGVERYVIGAAEPFVIQITQRTWGGDRAHGMRDPLRTITSAKGGEFAMVAPVVASVAHGEGQGDRSHHVDEPLRTLTGAHDKAVASAFLVPRYGEREGQLPRSIDIRQPHPTVVPDGNGGSLAAVHLHQANTHDVGSAAEDPLRTATGHGHQGVVAAYLGRQFGSTVSGRDLVEPHPTVMTEGGGAKSQVVAAYMAQGNGDQLGRPASDPVTTLTSRCTQQQLVAASLTSYYGALTETGSDLGDPCRTSTGKDRHAITAAFLEQANTDMVGHEAREPLSTIVGKGCTQRLVEARLALEGGPIGRRAAVLEFLWAHFGEPTAEEWADPCATLQGRLKFGLVVLSGQVWMVVDIGLRMLMPDELAAAMGFPPAPEYDLSRDMFGRPVSKVAQTEMIGNAVPRHWAAAHIAANAHHFEGAAA